MKNSYKFCRICAKGTLAGRGTCQGCYTKIRRFRAKQTLVKLFGEKCNRCGWKGNQAAFEFHHKNNKDKLFAISSVAHLPWQKVKLEAQKCEMICSNCHRIEHSNLENEIFLKVVNEYKGDLLK